MTRPQTCAHELATAALVDDERSDDPERKDWPREVAERASRKQLTRSLIIDEAARSMRLHGTQTVGLSALMKRVGRTHGGFYAHFSSRDELVAVAVERMFEATIALIERFLTSGDAAQGMGGFIDHYLSDAVRAHPERSCPIPSLSSEANRMPDVARERFLGGIDMLHAAIARTLSALVTEDADPLARSILFEMAGAMAMARVATDDVRGSALLQTSRDQLRRRMGLARSESPARAVVQRSAKGPEIESTSLALIEPADGEARPRGANMKPSYEIEDELDIWFDEYFHTFVDVGVMKKDAKAILDYWGVPLHSSDPERSRWFETSEEVVHVLTEMQNVLRKRGYAATRILDKKVSVYNVNAGRVDAIMSRRDGSDAEVDRAAVSFEIRRTDGGWIIISTAAQPTDAAVLRDIW